MAIVKGKALYHDSDKLEAVAAEEDRAAGEYSWLMAGIGDDWGRFRLSARAIFGEAYERRPAVTEDDVARWLAVFERHQLLRRYTVGGVVYAEWTDYQGAAASQRRFHHCPEPPWSDHQHVSGRCRLSGSARAVPSHNKDRHLPTHVPTHPGRQVDSQVPTQEGTQEGKAPAYSGAYPPGYPSDPTDPAVPTDPTDPEQPDGCSASKQPTARARDGGRRLPPADSPPAPPGTPNPLVGDRRPELEREGWAIVAAIAEARGEAPETVMARISTGGGKYQGSPKMRFEAMSDDRLLASLEDGRRELAAIRGEQATVVAAGEADRRRRVIACLRAQAQPANGLWPRVLEAVEARMNPHSFATWFRPLTPVGVIRDDDGQRLLVEAPNGEFVSWLSRNYAALLGDALREAGAVDVALCLITDTDLVHVRSGGGP